MELEQFLAEWNEDANGMKGVFTGLKELLESLEGIELEFIARPGITYSLRGVKSGQEKWPICAMVDVIDDDPSDRWLSVCFFGETISDPEEMGDLVPGGLLGRDGHCFDVEDANAIAYVQDRIREAYSNQ